MKMTTLQERGVVGVSSLSVADIVRIVDGLGIDPEEAILKPEGYGNGAVNLWSSHGAFLDFLDRRRARRRAR